MSGIYPAPWRTIGGIMDASGEPLSCIEDANGNHPLGPTREGVAKRVVEAINRAATEEPFEAGQERFKMERNCFLTRMRAEKLEEFLRRLAEEAFKYASAEEGLNDLAKEAIRYCNGIVQSDYADCIDYARYLLEKHVDGKRERICGVDLGDGPSEGKWWIAEVKGPDGTVRRWKVTPEDHAPKSPLTEPWWPEGAKA